MIKSKDDYKYYLKADRIALKMDKKSKYSLNLIWMFERVLRKVEYYKNCKKSKIYKPHYYLLYTKFYLLSIILGFTIPLNVFGPGLAIAHRGTIVVNENAKVGANCRIHVCTSIATNAGHESTVPIIGNNVYIGPGAKLFGDIEIADGIAIGANSVVNKSFKEKNITIAGIPAKKISDKGSKGLLVKATENIDQNKYKN